LWPFFYMKNYPFNFDTLFDFSNSLPYGGVPNQYSELFQQLNQLKEKYNFPAVNNDIGSILSFLVDLKQPKVIFEMGSGYGHSAFWYHMASYDSFERIYLTERREDLSSEFESLSWPDNFKAKMQYWQGDAFDKLSQIESVDFVLIDGQKSDYLRFFKELDTKLTPGGIVAIDNSFWRGSFLDPEMVSTKKSARDVAKLHEYLEQNDNYRKLFIPFKDGLTLLIKN
jgi:caffeoyl-CoA O-methyltransferase